MDFLWHKVSEKEQEDIRKEARQILEKFSKSLEKVEKEIKGFSGVSRETQMREESKSEVNSEFKRLFFKNAPNKDEDNIIAEKGSWK